MSSPGGATWTADIHRDVEDDEEQGLRPLVQHALSYKANSIQRLAHVQGIAAAAKAASYDDCIAVLGPMEELLGDAEGDVRLAALRQLAHLGELLPAKDPAKAPSDIQRLLLPVILPVALDDNDEVSRQAILAFQQLVALLPRDVAASAVQSALHRLEAQGGDTDSVVQAARIFAHTAASWSEAALHERVPDLLRRWCSHRDFTVREAIACCMSLVGEQLPIELWERALLPWFSQLCKDNNWRVRRAAALDLPRLAGNLHRHQRRLISRADSTCSCSTGSDDCGTCGLSNSACSCSSDSVVGTGAPRCKTSGVPIEQLGVVTTGGCAHLHSTGPPGYRRTELRARQQARPAPSSVWSAHTMRPSGTSATSSMGKHPLSSSLLVDGPAACGDSPPSSSSSSLSSSDGRPLESSLGPQPSSPSTQDDGSRRPAEEAGRTSSSNSTSSTSSAIPISNPRTAAPAAEEHDQEGLGEDPHTCSLAAEQPALHACWAALRECVDFVTADSSHWVKVTGLSGLGPCLMALPPCQLSGMLLGRFVGMGSSTTVIYEISVALTCAQSFSLVTSRLGPHRWPDMRVAFNHLQASRDPVVLQELVMGLPIMAQHLGAAILRDDLQPALLSIIHHHLSWVDAALIGVLAPLLEALPPLSHEPLMRVVSKLVQNSTDQARSRSWRLRRCVAAQLGRMARASTTATILDVLWPAAVTLCSDPVAAVRLAAAAEVGPLLAALLPHLPKEPEHQQEELNPSRDSQEGRPQHSHHAAHKLDGAPSRPSALRDQSSWRQQRRVSFASDDNSDEHSAHDVNGSSSDLDGCGNSQGSAPGNSLANGAQAAGRASSPCVMPTIGSPCGSSSSAGGVFGSSYGSSTSDDCDDGELFGGLPCALAAPPSGGLATSPPAMQPQPVGSSPATGGMSGSGEEDQRNDLIDTAEESLLFDEDGPGVGSIHSPSSSSSESESDSSGELPSVEAPLARTPVHPALGAMHPVLGAVHPVLGSMHPAMAPVGTWSNSTRVKGQPKRCASTGELLGSHHQQPPAAVRAHIRRRSTASQLSISNDSRAGGSPDLDPLSAPPSKYVDGLVQKFGRSSSFQGRQLFVTIGLSLLAHAAPLLPPPKLAMVTEALAALMQDSVAGVRIATEGAVAALQAAGAEQEERRRVAEHEDNERQEEGTKLSPGGGSREGSQSKELEQSSALPENALLLAARALARDHWNVFEATAAALCVHGAAHSTLSVPINICAVGP